MANEQTDYNSNYKTLVDTSTPFVKMTCQGISLLKKCHRFQNTCMARQVSIYTTKLS